MLTTALLNAMLAAAAGEIDLVSLHSADPGADGGAAEIVGGTYARQPITWNAPAAGSLDSSSTPTFDVPAGSTVAWIGFWKSGSPDPFRGSKAVTAETFAGAGTYTLSDADLSLSETP